MLGQADADPGQFIHCFSLRDDQTGIRMTDRLRFAFLEIGRFDKPMDECVRFAEEVIALQDS